MKRVAILSDTHAPRFWKQCPDPVADQLTNVDLILHAGDICTPDVLEELSAFAPVHAVLGNNDRPDVHVPERLTMSIEGVRVGMIHDSGTKEKRLLRLRSWFPDCDLVVFGHSHIPLHDYDGDFHIFNPGSPTDKRRQPHKTMGLLTIDGSAIADVQLIVVDQK